MSIGNVKKIGNLMESNAKKIIILGANSDIAKAIAKRYASEGYHLILLLRNATRIDVFAESLRKEYPIEIQIIEKDFDEVNETFKINSLVKTPFSGVVCCLGYMGNEPLAKDDIVEQNKILHRNFLACKYIIDSCVMILQKIPDSFVIGISSVAGDRIKERNYYYGKAKRRFSNYLKAITKNNTKINIIDAKLGFVYTKATEAMDLPKLLTTTPKHVANTLYNFQKNNRGGVRYIKWYWKYIMLIIKAIPEPIFKKLPL